MLELVAAAVSRLQGDQSNLALFWPTITGLIRGISKLATDFAHRYVLELKAAIDRHLQHKIHSCGGMALAAARSARACCLTLPKFRQGALLEGHQAEAKSDFSKMCVLAWQRVNPTQSIENLEFIITEEQPVEVPILPPAKRRRLAGQAELEQNICEAAGLSTPASGGAPAATSAPVLATTVRQRMVDQLQTWHDSPSRAAGWRDFWTNRVNQTTFLSIYPGVLDMLSESSHNGWGERFFGKGARVIQKLSGNLDVERKLTLHANGQLLGMEPYMGKEQWEANTQDFEFWEGKADQQELLL